MSVLTAAGIAASLPAGAIPIHAYVIIEYEHPGSDDSPEVPRVVQIHDSGFPIWGRIGLLQFSLQLELDAVSRLADADEE